MAKDSRYILYKDDTYSDIMADEYSRPPYNRVLPIIENLEACLESFKELMERRKEGLAMDIRNEVLRVIGACPKKLLLLKSDVQEPVIKHLGDKWERYGGYPAFAVAIRALELERTIKPVKNHGLNGLNPPLFLRYRKILSQQPDYEETKKEILSIYRSQIDLTHFLAFPQEYAARYRSFSSGVPGQAPSGVGCRQ